MYAFRPESNDFVSDTEDRKGKRPTRKLSVDIDAELKAGHAVESASDMQLLAIVVGRLLASSAQRAVDAQYCGVFRLRGCRGVCALETLRSIAASSTPTALFTASSHELRSPLVRS